ncbi:MAG: hypothetical protein PHS73_01275 [Candidatus Peribacteraceae bacterium]|nr:hypothetical protein [Candidatus Peribacteraceae bacterium]
MSLRDAVRRLRSSPAFLAGAGSVSLLIGCLLLAAHVRAVGELRGQTLPLLTTLGPLEQRLAVLTEQAEVSALNAALRSGSQEERVRAYVFPDKSALDRVLAVFALVQDDLTKRALMAGMSPIDVGETTPYRDGLTATAVTVRFTVRGEGMDALLSLVRLAGALTVGDALSRSEKAALIRASEDENPTGIVALEQFFATDLSSYAHSPRSVEDQVRRSFTGEAFLTTFRTVLEHSLLSDARTLFQGDLGRAIERARLWPIQFMQLKRAEILPGRAEDWFTVDITVLLLGRVM